MKSRSVFAASTSLVLVCLSFSCATGPQVVPGSERIRVLDAEPKGCIYVGEVASVQEEKTIGTLETEMTLDTRVDLRNKAHALGGNILVFLKGKNTNTLPGSTSAVKPGSPAKPAAGADVKATEAQEAAAAGEDKPLVFIGTVFKCPSTILNQ